MNVLFICATLVMIPGFAERTARADCTLANSPCVAYINRTEATSTSSSSLSFSHTVDAAYLRRCVVVCVAVRKAAGFPAGDVNVTATFNGENLQSAVANKNLNGTIYTAILFKTAPATGTRTVQIDLFDDATNPITADSIVASAITLSGVNQTSANPGNQSSDEGVANSPAANTVGTSVSGGCVVVDIIGLPDTSSATAGSGQVQSWSQTPSGGGLHAAGSAKLNRSGNTSMSESFAPGTEVYSYSTSSFRPSAVTDIAFDSGQAFAASDGVLLKWRTGFEANNLGFNVYRDDGKGPVKITSRPIAGSALFTSALLRAGYSYSWFDPQGMPSSRYWIEDVDFDGNMSHHGPIAPQSVEALPGFNRSSLVGDLDAAHAESQPLPFDRPLESVATANSKSKGAKPGKGGVKGGGTAGDVQFSLASQGALKLKVRAQGWYRVTYQDLVAAGIDVTQINPAGIRLFNKGKELAILVSGQSDGRFDPGDALEFFGSGLDTAWTDANTYWLIAGTSPGLRLKQAHVSGSPTPSSASFPYTVQLKQRLIYDAALNNGDAENFFGSPVSTTPVPQSLTATRVDRSSPTSAQVEIALQGVSQGQHSVSISANGSALGQIVFSGATRRVASFQIPASAILEGSNTVTLSATAGGDISLVEYVRLTYPRASLATNDELAFTLPASREPARRIGGFTTGQIRVFDVTTPDAPTELAGTIGRDSDGLFYIDVRLQSPSTHNLLAVTPTTVKAPAALEKNRPSSLNARGQRADIVMITDAAFADSLTALKALRESQGYRVSIVDIADIYDEFSFGIPTPGAITSFLSRAKTAWTQAPKFVLLVGDASLDPRNYFGFGSFDFIPTRSVNTARLEAVSDDAMADLDNDGAPDFAVGRLPARSMAEANLMVQKIVAYEQSAPSTHTAVLVSDLADDIDFVQDSQSIRSTLPVTIQVQDIQRDQLGDPDTRDAILAALQAGPSLVNYNGHGSVDMWRGATLTSEDVRGLSNTSLSIFTISNCLNGYFHDPIQESLGEAALKAEHGGAVAVWASSGITYSDDQEVLMRAFYGRLFGGQAGTIGEAAMQAKSVVGGDVRSTWILLGDPATQYR